MIGLDIGPLTLRDLYDMAYGAWTPWAELMAVTAEPHRDRDKRKQSFTMIDFHPFEKHRRGRARAGLPLDGMLARRIGDMLANQRRD